ncbi:MAG: SH3 domain-containing protein [Lachnospiraceae bacterium]|nr:SH3 domain-containing protein [Lachnospiraceae bacterium]
MKMKKIIALTLTISLILPTNVFGTVKTMPDVSDEMLDPGYWLKDLEGADDVLADADEIKKLNESYMSCSDCKMNDLMQAGETFDGETANLNRWKSALTELARFLDGGHYDDAENPITGKYVMAILNNLDDPWASGEEETRYGICVHRSDVRAYPTDLIIADDPGDNDFDNVQLSGVRVGEPVTVQGISADGSYYFCCTSCVSGWIPVEDVALCRGRDEWLNAWNFKDEDIVVVTAGKIRLEESNVNPELSELMLTMGTVLKKVDPSEYDGAAVNRSIYYNYPVWIPVRNEEGMYERRQALVSMHHEISEGYMPLTTGNIIKQAYEKLGDTYGWGAMLSSADCSSYVRDVYKCFGLELPRNTTWQSAMPVEKYDLSIATDDDKREFFDNLVPGAILFFKGHEMLYLGHKDDKYYVISASSSMLNSETGEKARIRSVIINSLDERRANGNVWISDLYEAAIPYILNEENVSIPVFSAREEAVAEESVSDNSVSENSLSDNSLSENSVSDNSVSENMVSENVIDYEEVAFDDSWEYAGNSKIHDGIARLYKSEADDRKDITICINAGHGTKGGTEVKTLCHPDGSPKIVTGSTAAGATEATAISDGTVMKNGDPEAVATLKAAMAIKEELLSAGYDVLMIRESDGVQLDNIARTLIANNCADVHIAIHYDSTDNGKGIFYCSVPNNEEYKNMEPVKSHWQKHEKLGKSLIYGLSAAGFDKWNDGTLEMDLTQTSYSTVPSVDLEIGDTVSDYSDETLARVAGGVRDGLDYFFDRTKDPE